MGGALGEVIEDQLDCSSRRADQAQHVLNLNRRGLQVGAPSRTTSRIAAKAERVNRESLAPPYGTVA
jgi:hypothetical protein